MNNHALKLVKEKGSISLKINNLVKSPEDEFGDKFMAQFYKKCKYYHKTQKGILRVSKYEFYSSKENRTKPLQKHDIEILNVDSYYDYPDPADDETSVWHLHFADDQAFSSRFTTPDSQEENLLMEMPLLYKACKSINEDKYSCILPTTWYKDGAYAWPTPVLFENVPQWADVDSENIELSKPILIEKKNNIISMKAPYGGKEKYSTGHIGYLCFTLFAGFGGINKQAIKSKVKNIEFHTGKWGCGNLHNNRELMILSQMCVASIMGFKKIYFHSVQKSSFENALKKFQELPEEFSYDFLVDYLDRQCYEKEYCPE